MEYDRVIPRDFFNEAKLLKSYGRLALLVLDRMIPDGITIEIQESGEAFDIRQNESDGSLFISNYPVRVNGRDVRFFSKYNSRDTYAFYASEGEEEIQVFHEKGYFTPDFIEYFKK